MVRTRKHRLVCVVATAALAVSGSPVWASLEGSVQVVVDVKKAEETSQPVAVGWSWRPVVAVSIVAKLDPPGEFRFGENSVTYPPGEVFARYSPDGKHWSSWHCLEIQAPKDRDRPEQVFRGTLRVPQRERQAYERLVREYSRMDVPWASDEEAAVKWILQKDPKFFEKSLPFVGYVQLLFETPSSSGRMPDRLKAHITYCAGGAHTPPRDERISINLQGPWRFKAD